MNNSFYTKNVVLIFILMFVLFSCKDRKKEFEKQILGDWNLARIDDDLQEEKDLEYVFRNDGFIFKDSGNLIEKRGFHDFNYKYSCLEKATLYKGDSTKYEIVNDHLKIFNLSYKTWDNYRIVSITSDSLVLEKEKGTNFIYYKSHYKIDADENYDRIIVSSSGCHGSCPMLNIEINKNGNVIYYGEYYNTKNGFYTLSISNKKYQNIEESFKKANIKNLKNFYSANWTDGNTTTVTFVRNNKIVKTISDYGDQSPIDFQWAYMKATYLYQSLNLTEYKKSKEFFTNLISIKNGDVDLNLAQSERFYILNEILNAKLVSGRKIEKYKVEMFTNLENKIIGYTDGRYFKFADKTIDIGYNFIDENKILLRTEDYE